MKLHPITHSAAFSCDLETVFAWQATDNRPNVQYITKHHRPACYEAPLMRWTAAYRSVWSTERYTIVLIATYVTIVERSVVAWLSSANNYPNARSMP